MKTALGFKWILGWETITNPQNELPLYIGAKFKTKLFEKFLKGV